MAAPDPWRFRTNPEGRDVEEVKALDRLYGGAQETVAVGTPVVVDLRGLAGFVVILNGGTATWQECDSAGTLVTGSSSTVVVDGARVDTPWAYVKITAATADCIVSTV